ncbi:MAG: hypothetical protein AAGM84_07060 [Pseudomonadota bacterium]
MNTAAQNTGERSISEHLVTIRSLAKARDFASILARIKPLRVQHPEHPQLLLWQARAQLYLRAFGDAKETIDQGDRLGLSMPAWVQVKIRLAMANGKRKEAVALGRILCARDAFPEGSVGDILPLSAKTHLDWDSVRLFARARLERDQTDPNALRDFYEAEIQLARDTITLADIETIVFERDRHPDSLVAIELFCIIFDTPPQDVEYLIEKAKRRWPGAEQIDHLTRNLAVFFDFKNPTLPLSALGGWMPTDIPDADHEAQAIKGMANKPVQISPIRPGKTVLLICLHSYRAIGFFDRYAAALGCTAVYTVDRSGFYGTKGLPGFAPSYAETSTKLGTLLRDLFPDHRLAIIGSSGGALAAMNFAADFSPERLVLLGPGTCADPAFQARIGDTRRPATFDKLVREVPLEFRNPILRLRQAPPQQTTVTYAGANSVDEQHAALLNDLPNLTIKADPDLAQHDIANYLARDGKMLSFLQGALFDQKEDTLQT